MGSGGSATASVRLSQPVVDVGDTALARVNTHAKFTSVDTVCFDFTFVNDLLDPGETVVIAPLRLLPLMTGPGFSNPGTSSQATRTLCLDSASGYANVNAQFMDGKEKDLEIATRAGSVKIASIVVRITGTAA
jgi:hypothetical protein